MRSVVVVLPASMCAMIPMLRVFSRGNSLGIVGCGGRCGRSCVACLRRPGAGKKIGPVGPRRVLLKPPPASLCGRGLHGLDPAHGGLLADEHGRLLTPGD